MKKLFIRWLSLPVLFFFFSTLGLAMTDQQGTDFWVGFPADSYPLTSDNLEIIITAINGASGQVQVPGIGYSSPFTIPAGGSANLSLPHSALVTIGDGTTAQGIHVTASSLVSVYGMDFEPYSTDGYLALPTVADGTSYYDVSYNSSTTVTYGSSFLVVGTQNATSVTINPVITVGTRPAGVPYTVTLNQGDTYQLLAPTAGTDLTGSSINSNQPIALLGAVQVATIPITVGAGNYIVEQLWPIVDWGTDYFTQPYNNVYVSLGNSVAYRYLASANNTTVNVNGTPLATLNAGQFVEQDGVTTAAEVTANTPIYVMEYNEGAYVNGGGESGDPSMATVPAMGHWTNQYLFPEDLNIALNPAHYYNLIVPASAVNSGVSIDGTPIPSTSYQAINAGTYYSTTLSLPFTSPHSLTSAVSFMALPLMLDTTDAYSFPAGGLFVDNGPAPTPIPSPTPFVPNPCKVLVYYDGDPGAASVTNMVNLLQLEGAQVTALPVTVSNYNPTGDDWFNYGQVWDARFMPQTIFGGCPGNILVVMSDYFGPFWANSAINYLKSGGHMFLQGESSNYASRNASSGIGTFLYRLGVVSSSFTSCPSAPDIFSNDSSLGQVTLPSTLPGTPNFFGDVVGGIPLADMTSPAASLVHMATGWTYANTDRSIVQGWSGAAQLPGAGGPNSGKLLMVWDAGMWTPADYNGLNGNSTNNFFTQVFYWLGGGTCGGPTPTPFPLNPATPTPTSSPTGTQSPTPTPTFSLTLTPTLVITGTFTPTGSYTGTFTPTFSPTSTPTQTPTWTGASTNTFTPTPPCQLHIWPDPFNPVYAMNQSIKFDCLPPSPKVSIYTLSGEWVDDAKLFSSGLAQWNGFNRYGTPASAGIYYYVIQSGSTVTDRGKFLLAR